MQTLVEIQLFRYKTQIKNFLMDINLQIFKNLYLTIIKYLFKCNGNGVNNYSDLFTTTIDYEQFLSRLHKY